MRINVVMRALPKQNKGSTAKVVVSVPTGREGREWPYYMA